MCFRMANCTSASVPMNTSIANSSLPSREQAERTFMKCYQSTVYSLMWPVLYYQPDKSYLVNDFGQYHTNFSPTLATYIFRSFSIKQEPLSWVLHSNATQKTNWLIIQAQTRPNLKMKKY